MSARHLPVYWSSCCGALADYIGYYQCRGCKVNLNLGREREPHLVSDPREAERIQAERAAVPDDEAERTVAVKRINGTGRHGRTGERQW